MMPLAELRRYLAAAYIDLRLFVTGKSEKGLPPLRLRDVGAGDFREVGEAWLQTLVRAGLEPTDRVLDIGSGIGRVAIPLTRYLAGGTYEGFDVVRRWVRWCRRNITRAHPNFRFSAANIYNSHYNRSGVEASRFRFPYPDASFDFAYAISVFTHLDVEAARNYLREAHRVLRPGGRLIATFFLVDGEPAAPALDFKVDRGAYRLLDEKDPDWAIAFTMPLLDEILPADAWRDRVIEPGRWRTPDGADFQDHVIVTRR